MTNNPSDSGPGSEYQNYISDSTVPERTGNSSNELSNHLFKTMDSNVTSIKENVADIKHKVDTDSRNIIADIATGAISSLIVAIIFLFVTDNIEDQSPVIFGIKVSLFVLYFFSIILVAFGTYFIARKFTLRSSKPNKVP